MSGIWKPGVAFDVFGTQLALQNLVRDVLLVAVLFASLILTPKAALDGSAFDWAPIVEVAKLFAAIFVTIAPVIAILRAGASGAFAGIVHAVSDAQGRPVDLAYFWATGLLSSFLDNAPTYLMFFNLAGGDARTLMTVDATTLAAISAGAVFMGANTYVGNAPNFMVKAIAESHGIHMLSFFGYLAWLCIVFLPLFAVMGWLFFQEWSMKKKVLVARPTFPDVIERLQQHFDVDVNLGDVLPQEEFARRLADRDGAFTAGEWVGEKELAGAPNLKVVANMAVGYDNFDMQAFDKHGVLGTNTPNVLNETTADFGWALMMAAARRIAESEHYLRADKWQKWSFDSFLGTDVYGSTLGIIGMGRIGQALVRRAISFDMRMIYHNRSRVAPEIEAKLNAEYASKEDLLRRADHVVLVLPYTKENHHTIGAAELALMKPMATLTNIARGGIVDDAALIEALRAKRIAAAGIDVFEGEPNFKPDFLVLDNVVLTPHIASATEATRRAMANLAADNLIAALGEGPRAGNPPNPINPDVLKK